MEPPLLPFGRPALKPLTDTEFNRLRSLLYQEAGIHLPDTKKALVAARLARRLSALGLTSYGAYYRVLEAESEPAERILFLDALCTNETSFFREVRQFDWLRQELFPFWQHEADAARRSRSSRIWSAACSTGEEPYSIAMSLLDVLGPATGWTHQVFASDLSTKVLARAEAGVWPEAKGKTIPERYRKRFMLRGVRSQEGLMKAGPDIRSIVHFRRLNLFHDIAIMEGLFDVIFCRNVLIYFNLESRRRVLQQLLAKLRPGGLLLLGHAESLNGLQLPATSLMPTVYQSTVKR